ncbi:MAG: stage III sporulation AC/AD family protein [Oscillospiraceae bacterium]|nr:stage III sporulation AC/AD family protein [Oscillospiraceae bacterium]
MDILLRVAAVAVAGSVIGLVLKKTRPEMSLLVTIALAVFAVYLAFEIVSRIIGFIRSLSDMAGISPAVISVVLKTVGIAIITKISADICRDAGQGSVASGVELAGTITAVYISLPLLESVISMIHSLL